MPMPSCSAASMIRRFFGTTAVTPFNVMVTVSFCSFATKPPPRGSPTARSDRNRRGHGAADQRQILVPELLDRARDRRGGGIAQEADRRAGHVAAELDQLIEILHAAVAVLDAAQHLCHPLSALPARRALPARLVSVEIDHA